MFQRIEQLKEKLLIGKFLDMSLSENTTASLWKSFMPELKLIENRKGKALYSLQIYPQVFGYNDFTPFTKFTKWAAVEAEKNQEAPDSHLKLTVPAGTYAVFLHQGAAINFKKTMEYIFTEWLPKSNYQLDDRSHFEKLGQAYKQKDPSSEEEVWIPVKAQ